MSSTFLALSVGWILAIPALIRLWLVERRVARLNGLLARAADELVDARAKLTNVRKNSIAARDYGLGSPLECSIWNAATQPNGPNVVQLVKLKGGAK